MDDITNGSPVNDEKKPPIPYLAHEAAIARQERTIKKLWILCIVIFLAFVWSNLWWVCYEMQFEDVSTTVTQETQSESGNAIIYGENAGAVIYGEGKANDNSEKKSP